MPAIGTDVSVVVTMFSQTRRLGYIIWVNKCLYWCKTSSGDITRKSEQLIINASEIYGRCPVNVTEGNGLLYFSSDLKNHLDLGIYKG